MWAWGHGASLQCPVACLPCLEAASWRLQSLFVCITGLLGDLGEGGREG